MNHLKFAFGILLLTTTISCSGMTNPPAKPSGNNNVVTGTGNIKSDVWADNWFAMYANGQLIKEDSVSITTERSFNKETFLFPADNTVQLAFVIKDFKENDTGLEYIGTERQQMGDGGLIAQFTNTTNNEVIAASDESWKCLVIHKAPLDTKCAKSSNPVAGTAPCTFTATDEPAGWKDTNFDDSKWLNASVFSKDAVGPKDGYDEVSWNPKAKFIWSSDLKTDNTILCRTKLTIK